MKQESMLRPTLQAITILFRVSFFQFYRKYAMHSLRLYFQYNNTTSVKRSLNTKRDFDITAHTPTVKRIPILGPINQTDGIVQSIITCVFSALIYQVNDSLNGSRNFAGLLILLIIQAERVYDACPYAGRLKAMLHAYSAAVAFLHLPFSGKRQRPVWASERAAMAADTVPVVVYDKPCYVIPHKTAYRTGYHARRVRAVHTGEREISYGPLYRVFRCEYASQRQFSGRVNIVLIHASYCAGAAGTAFVQVKIKY